MGKNNVIEKKGRGGRAPCVAKAVILSYAVSALMLLIPAYLLFKCMINEKTMSAFLMAIYFISAFTGGFFAGKCSGARKFAWGLLAGLIYYGILAAVSFLAFRSSGSGVRNAVSVFLMCAAGGTAGGMTAAVFQKNRKTFPS